MLQQTAPFPAFAPLFAPGPEGWTPFFSSLALPGLDPSFTMRVHPSFVPGDPGPIPEDPDEFAQEFVFDDPATGRSARLELSCTRMLEGTLEKFRSGLEDVIAGMGRSMARTFGGIHHGTRRVRTGGLQAVETYISGRKQTGKGGPGAMFGLFRSVIAEDMIFVLSFTSFYPARETVEGGYTPLGNPLLTEFGLPAMDSLTFTI
jgi:hypothetical protein